MSAEQLAHLKAQALRVVRLLAFALLAQPAVASLVSSTLLRYPLIAALVAAAEVVVREVWPTKSIPASGKPVALSPASVSAPWSQLPDADGSSVMRVAPGATATTPMRGISVPLGETGVAENAPVEPPSPGES